MFEYQGIFTRLIKYILEGIAVAIAASLMARSKKTLSYREIAIIAVTAALTFFLLDTLAPSISFGARAGSGFGIGANMVGMPLMVGGKYQKAINGNSGTQIGGNPFTEASGIDATSDAKALPKYYDYSPGSMIGYPCGSAMPTSIVSMDNQIISPSTTMDGIAIPNPSMPITGNMVPGSQYSGTSGTSGTFSTSGTSGTSSCLIEQGACANGSPLFTQPINNCDCALDCKPQCQPELSCPVSCPLGQSVFPNCSIASNNSPYKIVPGMFSHQIVLPGYNECVKPYNYFETPLGQN